MNRTRTTNLRYRGFYGWIIVMVALVSMAFWIGIRTSFSVFYVALLEEFSWSRGDSAGAQSLALITYTVLAPLVGWLIDRFGPRRVIVPGILVLVIGLVMCATIKTLTQFYIFYGVFMGSGITCIGIISYSAIWPTGFRKSAVWPVDSGVRNGTRHLSFCTGFPVFHRYCWMAAPRKVKL
ncbi:MAG: MFS transporter [Deltaproteobacteria bacterium]|nr:MFS transporter [Deltaproteobacteria bacterium]MBW1826479.1 MFS transporter [Deltaproteobacteria bacterium]MBW2156012.1 MFS transporter [Deltaproteobacteria bacterium]MBW2197044.1 MFS transporter [Deltaproteobacteria bacterium]